MANPIFIAQNLSNYTLTATSTNSSYPLTNLQDYVESTQWKSNSLANTQVLKIDFGAAVECDCIVLGNHNFASIVTTINENLNLDYSDNDSAWTNCYLWTHTTIDADPNYIAFTAATHRYWRLSWTAAGDLATYPALGNIYLAKKFDIGAPYNYGYRDGLYTYSTAEGVALNGLIRTSQQYGGGRKTWMFGFKSGNALSDAVKANWNIFFNLIQGKLRPFYFVDTDGTTVKFVHINIDENPVQAIKAGLSEIPNITLRAATVG